MLGFVKNWLRPQANPIGVDFGTDCLRMAQVAAVGNEWKLIAAACADVPSHVPADVASRMEFFSQTVRDLLAQGGFVGRHAILGLPSASTFIQHLRIPKMDADATKKAIPWEARGKLPIDPSLAMLRHHIAGEVYQEQEAKNEIILMAAPRDLVNQFLNAAARAKLNVRGMLTEPNAVVDCFAHIYRRKSDLDATSLFIDLGSTGARAFVARAGQTLFARKIPIGGEHLTRAVAASTGMNVEEARLLRLRLSNIDTVNQPKANEELEVEEENREGFALLGAALSAAAKENEQKPSSATMVAEPVAAKASSKTDDAKVAAHRVEIACHELLNKLVAELDLCRRYYEATFPNRPVDRLIFVGGEAKNRALCQHIARELGIAAQVGDPLVRMGRISDVGIESGIDRRQPQPNWAVAIGLSLGPRGGGDGDGN